MSKFKVLVTNAEIPTEALSALVTTCEMIICAKKPSPTYNDILRKCPGVDAILWAVPMQLGVDILDTTGPQLKIVSVVSVSCRHVNVLELRKRNIKVCHTPVVVNDAVANIVIYLMLATTRRIGECQLALEHNNWSFGYNWMLGKDIAGSTVGIVGLEALGQVVVKKLTMFGVKKFLYYGTCVCDSEECAAVGATCCDLDMLLRTCDFVICCCPPVAPANKRILFDDDSFSIMKETAVFINVAHTRCVDHSALCRALRNGTIFAAGLDVVAPEPISSDNELLALPNCIITPHIGSATEKTRLAMAKLAVRNIILALNGRPMLTPL